jgi:DNA-binding transcriptional LysR family regulator
LNRYGEPKAPQDLQAHNCIVYTLLATNDEWHFLSTEGEITVRVSGNYSTNSSEAVREGVLAGIGIAVTPVWLFDEEYASGTVQILLRDFEPRPLPIHAVYSSRRHLPSRVRALIEFLSKEFQADPQLAEGHDSRLSGKARVATAE